MRNSQKQGLLYYYGFGFIRQLEVWAARIIVDSYLGNLVDGRERQKCRERGGGSAAFPLNNAVCEWLYRMMMNPQVLDNSLICADFDSGMCNDGLELGQNCKKLE